MSAVAVPDLRLSDLSEAERGRADRLLEKLDLHQPKNGLLERYYDAKERVRDLGIAIPPHLRDLEAAIGWPGTAVDALEERLEHDGWSAGERSGDVEEIVAANHLGVEFAQARLDALIYGVSFVVAGRGAPGETDVLVTAESPQRMTGTYDRRRRRVTEALLVSVDGEGKVDAATLWYDGQVVELGRDGESWSVRGRPRNRLGRPPVHRLVNRPRSSDPDGRSEITRAVRAYTDHAVRTIVAMEVSRDFFAAPKFWLLGASESSFVDKDGNPKTAWETYIGRLNAIQGDPDGDGQNPDVKMFAGSSPAPFLEQLRGLAQLVAAEAALPVAYLGLAHDANPASADAALVAESRLNKRAERRQSAFGAVESDVMRDALWILDGREPTVMPKPIYRPAQTPTLAASGDWAQKLVKEGILPADSDVTLRKVGLSEADRDQVREDLRRARTRRTVSALAAAAEAARGDAEVVELDAQRG